MVSRNSKKDGDREVGDNGNDLKRGSFLTCSFLWITMYRKKTKRGYPHLYHCLIDISINFVMCIKKSYAISRKYKDIVYGLVNKRHGIALIKFDCFAKDCTIELLNETVKVVDFNGVCINF